MMMSNQAFEKKEGLVEVLEGSRDMYVHTNMKLLLLRIFRLHVFITLAMSTESPNEAAKEEEVDGKLVCSMYLFNCQVTLQLYYPNVGAISIPYKLLKYICIFIRFTRM